jgi:hypothetical protein
MGLPLKLRRIGAKGFEWDAMKAHRCAAQEQRLASRQHFV